MPNPYTSQSVGFGQYYDPEQEALNRQREMAQMLRQRAMNQDNANEVVAGRVIPYSWAQGLSKVASGYMGGKMAQDIEEKQADIYKKQMENRGKALEEFQRTYQGTPETQAQSMAPTVGNTLQNPQMITQPAVAGNPQAAYAALLRSNDPALAQMGMQGIAMLPQIEARKQEQAQARQDRLDLVKQQIEARKEAQQQNFENQKALRAIAAANGGGQPYFQPIQTAQGVMAFNARTGRMEPVQGGGQGIVGAQYDPSLQGQLAGAKASGTAEGKTVTERRLEAPQAIQQGEQTIQLVDDLLKAPGFKQSVGASRLLGVQNIPGTAAKDFDVRLDQLKGKQFLEAFQSLKGGGQITEVEGKKATDAISRMNAASSEAEFTKAAREFQDVIRTGINRAKGYQGNSGQSVQAQPARVRRFNPATGMIE